MQYNIFCVILSHTICHVSTLSTCRLLYVNSSQTLLCQHNHLCHNDDNFGQIVSEENLGGHDLVLRYLMEMNKYNFF